MMKIKNTICNSYNYKSRIVKKTEFNKFCLSNGFHLPIAQFNMHIGYISGEIERHPFISELRNALSIWDNQSQQELDYPLLMDTELPPLNRKSYESFIDKSYRIGCIYNENYPNPPEGGWITPANYLDNINDLVRTKISCKFIDGPEILAKKISELASSHGLSNRYSSRNHDDGYYAYHLYVDFLIDVPNQAGMSQVRRIQLEIQLSTQLKEVMYGILHKFYTDDRSKSTKKDWKWDVSSSKFKSGYLSHTLHLIEAMIIELRNQK